MTIATSETTEQNVEHIIDIITNKKGEDTILIDLREVTGITDFFLLTTGTSSVHVKAIADEIYEQMKKKHHVVPWHTEGYEAEKWILLDYVDIVVHVFDSETRAYYSIEKLWEDAKSRRIETRY